MYLLLNTQIHAMNQKYHDNITLNYIAILVGSKYTYICNMNCIDIGVFVDINGIHINKLMYMFVE